MVISFQPAPASPIQLQGAVRPRPDALAPPVPAAEAPELPNRATGGLTPEEAAVSTSLISAYRAFRGLSPEDGSHRRFAQNMHVQQGILGMRALSRLYPDYWLSTDLGPGTAPKIEVPASATPQQRAVATHLLAALEGFAALTQTHPTALDDFAAATERLMHELD